MFLIICVCCKVAIFYCSGYHIIMFEPNTSVDNIELPSRSRRIAVQVKKIFNHAIGECEIWSILKRIYLSMNKNGCRLDIRTSYFMLPTKGYMTPVFFKMVHFVGKSVDQNRTAQNIRWQELRHLIDNARWTNRRPLIRNRRVGQEVS